MSLASQIRPVVLRVRLFGDPVVTTPGRLKAGLGAIWILAALFGLAVVYGVGKYGHGLKKIGTDTVPSIIVAQRIKANLADMHSDAANLLLGRSKAGSLVAKDYDKCRLEVVNGLLSAAENITEGDAERVPLHNLIDRLGRYLELVAQARTLHEKNDPAVRIKQREADKLLHDGLLPAADALDKANRDALDHAYAHQRAAGWGCMALIFVTAAALAATLVVTQVYLWRRMRRRLNPGLLAATVLTALFAAVTLGALGSAGTSLKTAKEDAFESIHALWLARADAYDANGEESRWLLEQDDRERAAGHEKAFLAKTALIAKLPKGVSFKALLADVDRPRSSLPRDFEGNLAKALRNVTFPGEHEAAVEALKRFADYLAIDEQIRTQEKKGKHEDAVALCLGTKPGQSNWAFVRFNEALVKTIDINKRFFDQAVDAGSRRLAYLWEWAVGVALGVAGLAYFGLRPRLREYAL